MPYRNGFSLRGCITACSQSIFAFGAVIVVIGISILCAALYAIVVRLSICDIGLQITPQSLQLCYIHRVRVFTSCCYTDNLTSHASIDVPHGNSRRHGFPHRRSIDRGCSCGRIITCDAHSSISHTVCAQSHAANGCRLRIVSQCHRVIILRLSLFSKSNRRITGRRGGITQGDGRNTISPCLISLRDGIFLQCPRRKTQSHRVYTIRLRTISQRDGVFIFCRFIQINFCLGFCFCPDGN